jgi:hypothetical protein
MVKPLPNNKNSLIEQMSKLIPNQVIWKHIWKQILHTKDSIYQFLGPLRLKGKNLCFGILPYVYSFINHKPFQMQARKWNPHMTYEFSNKSYKFFLWELSLEFILNYFLRGCFQQIIFHLENNKTNLKYISMNKKKQWCEVHFIYNLWIYYYHLNVKWFSRSSKIYSKK